MKPLLTKIYGDQVGAIADRRLHSLLGHHPIKAEKHQPRFSESDTILITYGDSLQSPDQLPLVTLHQFAERFLSDLFSTIHLLPFFPSSSDDGFSVMDFYQVDEKLGNWADIEKLGSGFRLMVDFVLNHISAQSDWFNRYLGGEPGFENLAIAVDPTVDLSLVTRPRALPLLSEFKKRSGEKVHLWTTFSADQVDLNFQNIDVLEKMVAVLLFYVGRGAAILRLDAVAYLWKEIGTRCIHRPETHAMIKLFRAILDKVAPEVILLTETNVPHRENLSYFGNGRDEAQMVYNFTLPPLLLHAFIKADSTVLTRWAETLKLDSPANTFFNFTASHDGIGVRPLEGILPPDEITFLADWVVNNGGRVSSRKNPDGSESPYELNITYLDALRDSRQDPDAFHIRRFLASQAIQCSLPGIPAVYIHSLLGSRNWQEGVALTNRARTINREKLNAPLVASELGDRTGFRAKVYHAYAEMLKTRRAQPAFHPNASLTVLHLGHSVFAFSRSCESQTILSLTNLSADRVLVSIPDTRGMGRLVDILTKKAFRSSEVILNPYQYLWLCEERRKVV
ncbi:alpha-glucosidase C-terminal domain-containing protein [bacterium]|nr:alpha-glucosidase C-terminal domain-containing protein [bacterium]